MEWYIPLLIFLARICDVSLGTIGNILINAGMRRIAPVLGFFEVLIWVLAVGGVVRNLNEPVAIIAYAGGYATGVFVGMTIENSIALGYRVVHVFNRNQLVDASRELRDRGWAVTRFDGQGRDGPIENCMLIIPRRKLSRLRRHLSEVCPEAYITVERSDKPLSAGVSPSSRPGRFVVRPRFGLRK
jgi:uncharacterized protein YebE (UPF0316 family)